MYIERPGAREFQTPDGPGHRGRIINESVNQTTKARNIMPLSTPAAPLHQPAGQCGAGATNLPAYILPLFLYPRLPFFPLLPYLLPFPRNKYLTTYNLYLCLLNCLLAEPEHSRLQDSTSTVRQVLHCFRGGRRQRR